MCPRNYPMVPIPIWGGGGGSKGYVRVSAQNYATFRKNAHEIYWPVKGTPITPRTPNFQYFPKFVNKFDASQKKPTEVQNLTNNVILRPAINEDTLRALYHPIMLRLKDFRLNRSIHHRSILLLLTMCSPVNSVMISLHGKSLLENSTYQNQLLLWYLLFHFATRIRAYLLVSKSVVLSVQKRLKNKKKIMQQNDSTEMFSMCKDVDKTSNESIAIQRDLQRYQSISRQCVFFGCKTNFRRQKDWTEVHFPWLFYFLWECLSEKSSFMRSFRYRFKLLSVTHTRLCTLACKEDHINFKQTWTYFDCTNKHLKDNLLT